jgi:hypothetical protein
MRNAERPELHTALRAPAGSPNLAAVRSVASHPNPATPSQRGPPYLPNPTPDNPPNHPSTATGSPVDRSKDLHRNGLV